MFSEVPLQQKSPMLRIFKTLPSARGVLWFLCYLPPPPATCSAPALFLAFLSYKALEGPSSEEVRLHSEEMGEPKWSWDCTRQGSRLHLAA